VSQRSVALLFGQIVAALAALAEQLLSSSDEERRRDRSSREMTTSMIGRRRRVHRSHNYSFKTSIHSKLILAYLSD
jgi:hypothetical protein